MVSKATPQVKYVRNLNHVESNMNSHELMQYTLPDNYLYAKIAVGEQATHFFTETMLGADFDRRLRERHKAGFEALIAANPQDASAVAAAQLECMIVIGIYDTITQQIQEGQTSKEQMNISTNTDEGE